MSSTQRIFSATIPINSIGTNINACMLVELHAPKYKKERITSESSESESYSYNEELEIRLINNISSFSFYLCKLSPSIYISLKSEQNLRLDFDEFRSFLIQLFEEARMKSILLEFEIGKKYNILKFIESSKLKNICILKLPFRNPSSTEFKKYLNSLINELEQRAIKYEKENKQFKEHINYNKKKYKQQVITLNNEVNSLRIAYDKLINSNEKEKKVINELKIKYQDITNRYLKNEEILKNFKIENESQKVKLMQNKENIEENLQLKNKSEELKGDLEVANGIIKNLRIEVKTLKDLNKEQLNKLEEIKIENERKNEEKNQINNLELKTGKKLKRIEKESKKLELQLKNEKLINERLQKQLENSQNVLKRLSQKEGVDFKNFGSELNTKSIESKLDKLRMGSESDYEPEI